MSDTKVLRESATFPADVLAEIHRAADQGIYDIRGFGTKRAVPSFDDLLFLGASMSRYPLEGYREKCATNVTLGTRFAENPIELDIPITIAGMSFGALGANAKEALGRGATMAGTSTTTGDGGMTEEERQSSKMLVYQVLPSRYGLNPDDLRRADALEVVVGQGAKPGGGGMLLGQKITERVAEMRNLPVGIDQRSACRHPDWTGPDDLEIKIQELREITDWRIPIYIKVGATRVKYDVALAVKAGADVIVVDGMQGGTAATQDVFIEHVGIPSLPATRLAVEALQELDMHRKVQLWRSARMPFRSAVRQWSRSAAIAMHSPKIMRNSARCPDTAIIATPVVVRWALPRRILISRHGCGPSKAPIGYAII
jgi:glutamate synthase domain-containing protein 2